jgi:hypothetical protein
VAAELIGKFPQANIKINQFGSIWIHPILGQHLNLALIFYLTD